MERILEPELMNEPEQVAAYAGPDLDNACWLFVQCLRKYFPDLAPGGAILDLGCGTAAIPLRLARLFPDCEIHGVDGAPRMLEHGRQTIQREGLTDRIQLIQGILPEILPVPRRRYEVIISNSFLHHLADPMVLWDALHQYSLPDAAILIIDLLRPADEKQTRLAVDRYMPEAPPLLHQDMMHSLHASFTMDEIAAQLQAAGLAEDLSLTMATPIQFAVHGRIKCGCPPGL